MSVELLCLVWSVPLGLAYISAQVVVLRIQQRGRYDPNNDRKEELNLHAGRADRALRNFLESYPLFVALAVAVQLSGSSDWLTQWGAVVYLVARVIYLPLYILGLGRVRSAFWTIAFIGLAMMFIGVLF